jgi:hypothetical protein
MAGIRIESVDAACARGVEGRSPHARRLRVEAPADSCVACTERSAGCARCGASTMQWLFAQLGADVGGESSHATGGNPPAAMKTTGSTYDRVAHAPLLRSR